MNSLDKLINQFTKLPGVGRKAATRYAYYVVSAGADEVAALADTLLEVKQKIKYCSVCGTWAEIDTCDICATRDTDIICVVKEPKDVFTFERIRDFEGTYHVLHGTLNPLDNIGPDNIRIKELLNRVKSGRVKEVIMATNPDVEGESTAMYIARLLKPLGIKVTRIAQGITIGTDIEYASEVTLSRALQDRKEI
ncbi:MAG: recombination mediator RecR [Firmicutes bacterium]|nr:recombination mediator RecR [Bacillota bacterium]